MTIKLSGEEPPNVRLQALQRIRGTGESKFLALFALKSPDALERYFKGFQKIRENAPWS